MSKAMKDNISKMIIPLAGIALVVPFLVVGLFVGALAVAEAQSMMDNLLLVALAAGSALARPLRLRRQATNPLMDASGKQTSQTSAAVACAYRRGLEIYPRPYPKGANR